MDDELGMLLDGHVGSEAGSMKFGRGVGCWGGPRVGLFVRVQQQRWAEWCRGDDVYLSGYKCV